MPNIQEFHFARDWTNPADFPSHQNSEAQNRADLQEGFTAWETYWNHEVLPKLNEMAGGGGSGSAADVSGFLPLAGGTMTGPLRLSRAPQFDREAATKAYVDAAAQSVMADGVDSSAIAQLADQIELLVQRREDDLTQLGRFVVRADEITAQVANNLGYEALARLLVDQIKLEVSQIAQGDRVAAGIVLKVFNQDAAYGQILLDGNVDVSGQLSADALYSPYGEIANLYVNHFETSRRIVKYLKGDQSNDNFIRAQDQFLDFVEGKTTGATEQARNPNGALLYWPMDVSGLPLGADGYPLNNGERVFTVTQATAHPVTVYKYAEAVKRSIRFEAGANGIANVYDTFGAGNASGLNRASISKTANEWDFMYTTSGNKVIGMHMHNEGFVDIDGLRKTTALDFSHFHEGYFTETVQGAAQPKEYHVSFDANGTPTGITDESGNTTALTW